MPSERFAVLGGSERPRFLFYSHDGLGLGHVRRNLAIARARGRQRSGVDRDRNERPARGHVRAARNVDVLRLPALRKLSNGHYAARRLPVSAADVSSLRSDLLAAAVRSLRPRRRPRRQAPARFYGELEPALDALAEAGGRAVLGLRDILDAQEAVALASS